MNRKKAAWIGVAAVAAAMAAAVVAGGLFLLRRATDYDWVVRANWGIPLPRSVQLVYQADSGASFHGDGIRYHVFCCAGPEPVEQMVAWGPEGLTRCGETYTEAAEGWLTEIQVPPVEWPGRAALFWYQTKDDGSEVILFWEREEERLCLVESFL